ncbi:AAA family ATPase [Bacillus weihaiensis]|uniref:AAA family ATPase n=1 Tax=Bacillus weihaiensis TaxID=1547283 RepID=UPI0023578696|nr:AAA family ATPase [Bacillus weihaiensis]
MLNLEDSYVHLTRLALEGRKQDILTLIKRNIKQFDDIHPGLSLKLKEEILSYQDKLTVIRKKVQPPLPIDLDSKLELVKSDSITFESDPTWPEEVGNELNKVIQERKLEDQLISSGLFPTRSTLFVGEPGVGKTLAARWISAKLERPLLTLDLAAVMSSYLGKTGNNIRAVLDYAKKSHCILLLDEFDAIAKKRGDDSEVGELKRLVTVLLQEIDEWPATGLLIAATNHEELLDPAVWRRFERVIKFPKPSLQNISYTVNELLKNDSFEGKTSIIDILSLLLVGKSFSDVTKEINNSRKESIIQGKHLSIILEELIERLCKNVNKAEKIKIALMFLEKGYSQRKTAEILGLSRDTIRKYANNG